MKAKILQVLRQQKGSVSGEQLSSTLGISRVSVWKHIHKLQDLGYEIQTGPGGYQLMSTPDVLYPWEFPGRESRIYFYPELSSTMDLAKDLARQNCPEFTVVIAGRQTHGRGRLNRMWLSDDGGLYFTMVLRPDIPLPLSARVNFLASLTLARMFRETFNIEATVKWPNDILVDGRKISGMLSELEAEADRVFFINIGMGINVNNNPSEVEPAATSLRELSGQQVDRRIILAHFLNEFEEGMQKADFDNVISEWKKFTVTLNRRVRIVTRQEVSEGLAVDVENDGALLLEMAEGTRKKIVYGDCFLL